MSALEQEIFNQLGKNDRSKIHYFMNLLLNKEKYNKFKKEIARRKTEVRSHDIIEHDEFWESFDV